MDSMGPHGHVVLLGGEPQMVSHVDPAYHQDTSILFDLANGLGYKAAFTCRNLARFQRAPQGSSESASGRRYKVIERRRMRLLHLRIHTIMFGHLGVNSEQHWLRCNRQVRLAQRSLNSFDPNPRTIGDWIGHNHLPLVHARPAVSRTAP